jgi:molecular chaperone GrpE
MQQDNDQPRWPERDESPTAASSTTDIQAATSEPAQEQNFAADLEKQLEDALGEAAKLKDALLRAVADSDNMRKRTLNESESARKYALESFANELLTVKDSLEAALAVDNATLESYRNGVELTLKQLANVFSKFNISEINPAGEKFDPHRHQAIAMVEAPEEANTVVNIMQKGYALHDRILRPALVTVAKPKSDA